jgi:glycine cleavage system protein P-like pyridoxal-binding family
MCHVADGDKMEKKRRKVAEANGTEPAAPDVNGFKAMEVPVVANGEAIQDKMKKKKKKKKAESQVAVHSQG